MLGTFENLLHQPELNPSLSTSQTTESNIPILSSFFLTIKNLPKIIWILIFLILLLMVTAALWWWNKDRQLTKEIDRSSYIYEIELPKGFDKNQLLNLPPEEKNRLNRLVSDLLNQLLKSNPPASQRLSANVVLTQNGQPIFSNPKSNQSGSTIQTISPPTVTPTLVSSPTSVPAATSTPVSSPTPTTTPANNPSSTPSNYPTSFPTITPTLIPGQDLVFNIDAAAASLYRQHTNEDLALDIDRFYNQAKTVYGPPRQGLNISVLANANSPISYNLSTNTISIGNAIDDNLQFGLINAIIAAFHDDLIYYMPQNWEAGLSSVATYDIYKTFFNSLFETDIRQAGFYSLYNTPAVANRYGHLENGALTSLISNYDLAVTALYGPYMDDNRFLVKLNQAIYQENLDSTLYQKVGNLAASIKTTYLNQSFSDWLSKQYVLAVDPIPGNYLVINIFYPNPVSHFALQALNIAPNGDKSGQNNLTALVNAWNAQDSLIWTAQATSDANGIINFRTSPALLESYIGCLKYKFEATGFPTTYLYYPYENGSPLIFDQNHTLGIFGCVQEQTDGDIITRGMYSNSGHWLINTTDSLTKGSFKIDLPYGGDQFKGYIEFIYFKPYQGVYPSYLLDFWKVSRNYYLSFPIDSASPSSTPSLSITNNPNPSLSQTPSPTVKPSTPTSTPTQSSSQSSSDCATGWQTRTSTNFNISVKYPLSWTHDSPGRSTADNPSLARFALTDWPYGQPRTEQSKWDSIDVLASTTDLKNTEYGEWFVDYIGLQKKTTITFQGLSAEKYVTDVFAEGGEMYMEKYYFKGGNNYYIIRGDFFVDRNTYQQKLALLQCFLNNFRFVDD